MPADRPSRCAQPEPGHRRWQRRHRARQRDGQDAVDVQEAEQGPQRGHDPLRRPLAPHPRLCHYINSSDYRW